jgi:hypothetical protein
MREGNAPMPADGAINVLYSISFSFDSNWRFSHLFAPDGGGFASGEEIAAIHPSSLGLMV